MSGQSLGPTQSNDYIVYDNIVLITLSETITIHWHIGHLLGEVTEQLAKVTKNMSGTLSMYPMGNHNLFGIGIRTDCFFQ